MQDARVEEPCFVCGAAARVRGLACATCVEGLVPDDVCPEQIGARVAAPIAGAANAWLIDGFGTPHTLSVGLSTPPAWSALGIGRDRRSDLWIAERTVSQVHAGLEHRALSNAWFVVHAGGDNGTWVNDDRVKSRFPLEPRDRICLGRRIGFVFMPLDEGDLGRAAAELRWLRAQAATPVTVGDAGADHDTPLRVAAVTEGGAICTWAGERAQLSELELELLVVLHERQEQESALDATVRGFVPASQLLERLSFRSEAPTHANLRGLVRKLRRKLADGERPLDVIESRQGLGYRLARPVLLA